MGLASPDGCASNNALALAIVMFAMEKWWTCAVCIVNC
jgi:hypothetical protein